MKVPWGNRVFPKGEALPMASSFYGKVLPVDNTF